MTFTSTNNASWLQIYINIFEKNHDVMMNNCYENENTINMMIWMQKIAAYSKKIKIKFLNRR